MEATLYSLERYSLNWFLNWFCILLLFLNMTNWLTIYMESDDPIFVHFVFKYKIKSWGSNPICYSTLVVFNWFLFPMTCLLERQTFFVLVLCAIMKIEEGLVYLLKPYSSLWSWLSHPMVPSLPFWMR